LKYRPDIDGLRAIAVLSVIAFHLGLSTAPGGFVGVDVFFVISGYLISSIIFNEVAAERFSIVGFYERRIRRIFPALFGMLVAFSVFAAIYLLPSELISFAKSMLATTVSASNFYFWRHSGYFDLPTSQPLLHTWSLAVEEQFYIAFPLLLLFARRFFPRQLRASVIALFFVSLLVSAIVVVQNRVTAFYMPYTRAWELLLGTMLSLRIFPHLRGSWLRNLATLCGIGMIGFSVRLYSQETEFPGMSALMPCVGSALIIGAGEYGSSLIAAVLAWRPLVFVGLISYSLYLWHWPVIVMQQMGVLLGASDIPLYHLPLFLTARRLDMLVEVGLSFVLAVLSWKFVERPFRRGSLRMGGRLLFSTAGGATAMLLVLSSTTILAKGFRGRFPAEAVRVASSLQQSEGASADLSDSYPNLENRSMRTGICFITSDYHFDKYDINICLHEYPNKRNYLLLGDSHSAMLWGALSSSLRDANVMQASTNACEPVLHPSGSPDCRRMMSYVFDNYLHNHRVDGLFMVARWEEKDIDELTATIAWAKQHQLAVTVFGPMPEYDGPLPRLLAYSIAWNEPSLPSRHRVASTKRLDEAMQNMATTVWEVAYISLYREICGAEGCLEYVDAARQVPLMGDTNHLNRFGASFVVQHLVERGKLQ
jgi:peptidoglycan/LPS O-acetylase OafA/YrhL